MKALAASLATAAVLAGAAWANNVTPQQIAKLSARVTKLERSQSQLAGQVAALQQTTACLTKQWRGASFQPYLVMTWDGFATKSGNATLFTAPAPADGLVGTGYLVSVDGLPTSSC